MTQDPAAHQSARGVLEGLFRGLGQHGQGQQPSAPAGLNADWMLNQFMEFVEMPIELAQTFTTMATDLTDLVLKALAEAGIELVKGLTPV